MDDIDTHEAGQEGKISQSRRATPVETPGSSEKPKPVSNKINLKTAISEARNRIGQIVDERREAKIQQQLNNEFEAAKKTSRESHQEVQVPYTTNLGIKVKTAENPQNSLHTGMTDNERARDCNAVVIVGENGNAMAHISPQTLNDDYLMDERRGNPTNHRVDLELNKALEKTGKVKEVIIVGGHDNLGYMLKSWMTNGEENPWAWEGDNQKPGESPHLDPRQIEVHNMGMGAKEVLLTQNVLWIKDHSTGKATKLQTG